VTEVLRVDPATPDPAVVSRAAELLRAGRLVAFPTETVYGLGAHALDRTAVRRIFAAKGRPASDPLIVHVAHLEQVTPLVDYLPDVAQRLAVQFWPGPLTLVLRRSPAVPDEVTAGLDTVAVRIPAHAVARAILGAAALPIAAPSANLFSRPSPTRAEHVLQDLEGRIDAVVDAGPTQVGLESTVLDLSGERPTVLRPGAVTLEMLRQTLPDVELRDSAVAAEAGAAMPAPGLLARHYSPQSPLTLYEGDRAAVLARMCRDAEAASRSGRKVALLVNDEDDVGTTPAVIERLGPSADLESVAARLYAAVRKVDGLGVDEILVHGFSSRTGLGLALQDRLRRAAAGRVVHVTN
jgi:L-threonylcarbamoyladenylate synthase